MNAIELNGLSKHFGKGCQRKLVLSHLNLSLKKGTLFSILGENGAGKTTLIKILSTLILPDEGTVSINGFDVEKNGEKVRASIGLVTGDERSFYWRLTATQNLRFYATLQNLKKKQAEERIEALICLVGLAKEKYTPFRMFSSGMKQRLNIARALLHDPQILLLDEPTKGLDPIKIMELQKFIREVLVGEEKKTVLLATHDLKEAEAVSDNVGILHQGKLVFQAAMDASHNYETLRQKFIDIVGENEHDG